MVHSLSLSLSHGCGGAGHGVTAIESRKSRQTALTREPAPTDVCMHTWKCAASRNAYSAIVYSFSWHAPSRSGHTIDKSNQCQTDQVQQLGTEDGWRVSKDLSLFGVSMLTHTLMLTYLLTYYALRMLTYPKDGQVFAYPPPRVSNWTF